MKLKKILFLIISSILVFAGCTNSETEVKNKIYETFFKNIVKAGIPKILPENISVISGSEIEIFKPEFRKCKRPTE